MFRFVLCFVLVVAVAARGEETSLGVVNDKVTLLATGFSFTEGPAVSPDGDIYFTDIPKSRIHKWSLQGVLSTVHENSGKANGLIFDKAGSLVVCEGGNRRVVSINPAGELSVLADSYDGKKLNSPNDLWIHPSGGMYFTDPRYGKGGDLEQDGEHVYYLPPDDETLVRIIDDMVRPNGIVGTKDGKKLYVADHGGKKTYVYTIKEDGTLSDKKLFVEEGSDGMTLDTAGNLYITTDKVLVYSPEGQRLSAIEMPETPSNVCFGSDMKTLYITARRSLYAICLQIP